MGTPHAKMGFTSKTVKSCYLHRGVVGCKGLEPEKITDDGRRDGPEAPEREASDERKREQVACCRRRSTHEREQQRDGDNNGEEMGAGAAAGVEEELGDVAKHETA